ncbi:NUC091 domain-containing protein [Haematococcus lacustris]
MTKKSDAKGSKGSGKKSPAGAESARKPKHSNDANRASKGVAHQRSAATVRRLNMYKKRPKRDTKGRVLHEDLQSKDLPTTRIQPDRRWFGNTRVIGQKQLEDFRNEMSTKVNDAYTVLLKEKKLPLQLLEDPDKKNKGKQIRHNLIASQPYQDTFGKSAKRKKPRLAVESIDDLVTAADGKLESFVVTGPGEDTFRDPARDAVFDKSQSRRIWGELYKVLDSSDVIIQVLDARDPMGTRCQFLEHHIRKHLRHKHLLLLLNKCDLVPSWVTKRWLHFLSREFPTLAFHASITNPFGKGALLSLLRQLARLRTDKQAISVGFVGYPNVGKSSVINTLRTKKVCKTAPIPGQTKVWQYITLMKRIFLIDCPGVVYNKAKDSDSDAVLKGVVRVENLEDATEHVTQVLRRVKPEYLKRAYKIKDWTDHEDFLTQLGRVSGKLLKGGDADLNTAARMVLYDWQRGKIPFFTRPPDHTEEAPVKQDTVSLAQAAVVPAGAVTEEDAVQEAGARPEEAAAAARAAQELLSSALALQSRTRIPVQKNYFMPEDEQLEGSLEDEGCVEDEVLDSDAENQSCSDEVSEHSSEDGTEGQQQQEQLQQQKRQMQQQPLAQKRSKTKQAAAQRAAEDSGNDSDGYGQGGLSWEAVLSTVKGEGTTAQHQTSDKQPPIAAVQVPIPAAAGQEGKAKPKGAGAKKQEAVQPGNQAGLASRKRKKGAAADDAEAGKASKKVSSGKLKLTTLE